MHDAASGVGDRLSPEESDTPTIRRVHPGMQPDTYEEAMLYLEGRRRWLAAFAFAADAVAPATKL